jgi:hypothetical protein
VSAYLEAKRHHDALERRSFETIPFRRSHSPDAWVRDGKRLHRRPRKRFPASILRGACGRQDRVVVWPPVWAAVSTGRHYGGQAPYGKAYNWLRAVPAPFTPLRAQINRPFWTVLLGLEQPAGSRQRWLIRSCLRTLQNLGCDVVAERALASSRRHCPDVEIVAQRWYGTTCRRPPCCALY